MQKASRLTVTHHDDTTQTHNNVNYELNRHGLRIVNAEGAETHVPRHDYLTTHVTRNK